MSLESTVADGRAAALARMVDVCTIVRAASGEPVWDPNTSDYADPAEPTTVYTGACEVQVSDGLNAREAEAGGTEITLTRVTVKIPVSATGVQEGDVVTITSSENDPDLVDQEFRVIAGHAKSFGTARRLQVERLTT